MLAAAGLGFKLVHEVDDVEEATAGASADERAGDGDREMALACARAADEHDVALVGDEVSRRQLAHEALVDGRHGEVELLDVLGQRQLGDRHLVADRTRLLLGDLGLEQVSDDPRWLVLALDAVRHDLVIGAAHPVKLEGGHQVEDLGAVHVGWSS